MLKLHDRQVRHLLFIDQVAQFRQTLPVMYLHPGSH